MTLPTPAWNNDEQLHLGVSWYPELWPEEEWTKDVVRMREVGFTMVRLFEFAWKRFEPAENEFDFDCARGGEGVLCCPRVDAGGRPSALGLVNTRKEAPKIAIKGEGTDLLSGAPCSGEVRLAPLQVRLVRYA